MEDKQAWNLYNTNSKLQFLLAMQLLQQDGKGGDANG